MRRFLVIVVASLVPVGMWTAGCRQERQAAFPNSPEMASLAKSGSGRTAEAESPTTPPEIPPAPIDRSVMHLSDSSVLARVQAVSDRADQLAGSTPDDGLFTLPDLSRDMASAPAIGPSSAAPAQASAVPSRSGPLPSGREFWSKPVAARTDRPVQAPADISAMAPAAAPDYIQTPPAHYQAPAAPSVPSMPSAPTGSRLLPPEDVPGVFLFDESPLSSLHSPPASRHSGLGLPGGDALSAPPLSSNAAASRLQHGRMRSVDTDGKATAQVSQRGPIRLDLSGLVPTSARRSAPAEAAGVAPRSEPASAMPLYREVSEQTATSVARVPVRDEPVSAPIITLSTSPVHEALPEPVPLSALASMPSFQPLPDSFPTAMPMPSAPASAPVPESVRTPAAPAPAAKNAAVGPAQWVASPTASAQPAKAAPEVAVASVTSTRRPSGTMSLPVPLMPSVPAAKPMEAPLPFEEMPESPTTASTRARSTGSDDISQALAPLPDLSGGTAAKIATSAPTAMPVRSAAAPRQADAQAPVAANKQVSASSTGEPLAAPSSRPAAMASMPVPARSAARITTASQSGGTSSIKNTAQDSASKRPGRIPEVTLPQPVPEALPTPELTAAKTVLMDFSPEALDEVSLPSSVRHNEFFKTDFWESKAPAAAPASATPAQPVAKALSLPLPELPMPAAPNRLEKDEAAAPALVAKTAAPSAPAMPNVEPREPIWVDSLPTSRQQEKETVPEYRYEVTPKQPSSPAPAMKTRIDTVEARDTRKESAPPAPKKVKLTPIRKSK